MRKIVLVTLSAVMTGILLVGCGDSEADKKHKENVAYLADQKKKDVSKQERFRMYLKCAADATDMADENARKSRALAIADRAKVDKGLMTETEYDKNAAERLKKYPSSASNIMHELFKKAGLSKAEIEEFKHTKPY